MSSDPNVSKTELENKNIRKCVFSILTFGREKALMPNETKRLSGIEVRDASVQATQAGGRRAF
jgi:hypothetical protein